MSEIAYSKTVVAPGPVLVTWTGIGNGDTGQPIELVEFADRGIQVEFANPGTVTIEGSIDGTNYRTLTDPQGNALTITSGKIEQITELVRYLRPSGSGVGLSATVNLLLRKP